MATESLFVEKKTKPANLRYYAGESKKGVQNKTPDRFRPLGYLYENDTKSGTTVIQAKLIYQGEEVPLNRKKIQEKLNELQTQGIASGLSDDAALQDRVIRQLIGYIRAEEEYTLDQGLIERTIAREQERMNAEQALQIENQKRAQNLFDFLIQCAEKSIEVMSAENLIKVFSDFDFEASAEISKKSGVLGTMIVHASAGGKEYLYVELHPKGGIHYSSYVLICLYDTNKKVIGRHKVVMSKSSLYLGKNQEPTTTFDFLRPNVSPSDLPSKEYHHHSRYFAERSTGRKYTPEGVSLLERMESQLFSMSPVEMAKGKQMLGLGIWDEELYDSVHRMRDERQREILSRRQSKNTTGNTEIKE